MVAGSLRRRSMRTNDVLGVELEVEPGAAVGNDPRRIQQLAGGVGLALVVVEEHTGRAVQLGDDDPLGAVDDEGAVVGHERHVAHVDVLLLDILDGLGGGILVVDDQPHPHPQGNSVGHAPQLAVFLVERRLAQAVIHVFQGRIARQTDNGKHRLKGCVQTGLAALVQRHPHLGEIPVGIQLDSQQWRQLHHLPQLAEILANAFFLSVGVGH